MSFSILSILRHKILHAAIIVASVFVASVAVLAQANDSWKKVESPSDSFSIIVPGDMTRTELPVPSGQKAFTHTVVAEGVVYSVINVHGPGIDWTLPASKDSFVTGMALSACAQTIASGGKCQLKAAGDVHHKGNGARDLVMTINDKKIGVGRIVFVGPWVYTLMVMSVDIDAKASVTKKFMESFEVMKTVKGDGNRPGSL